MLWTVLSTGSGGGAGSGPPQAQFETTFLYMYEFSYDTEYFQVILTSLICSLNNSYIDHLDIYRLSYHLPDMIDELNINTINTCDKETMRWSSKDKYLLHMKDALSTIFESVCTQVQKF